LRGEDESELSLKNPSMAASDCESWPAKCEGISKGGSLLLRIELTGELLPGQRWLGTCERVGGVQCSAVQCDVLFSGFQCLGSMALLLHLLACLFLVCNKTAGCLCFEPERLVGRFSVKNLGFLVC
jgi:hypothetical protein